MSSDTLILIHVISRHGDKTTVPRTFYPNDPHKSNKFHPYGPGMLTNEGKRTMYTIGKAYRERYDDFLGELYLPEYLEVWTTDYVRTKTSAQIFLAALFPPKSILKWNDGLDWQPIATNYIPLGTDELLGGAIRTEKYLDTYNKVYESDFGKAALNKYNDIIPHIEKHTGLEVISLRKLWVLRDCFQTEEEFGLPLPEWSKSVYPERLLEVSPHEHTMQTCTKELKRLACGKLFKKILTDTQNKIDGTSTFKMHLYVGHDMNISTIHGTLGLHCDHLPKYGASMVFEVHQIQDRYGIKLFYKKSKTEEFEVVPTNSGEAIWWLEDFKKIVEDLYNDDGD